MTHKESSKFKVLYLSVSQKQRDSRGSNRQLKGHKESSLLRHSNFSSGSRSHACNTLQWICKLKSSPIIMRWLSRHLPGLAMVLPSSLVIQDMENRQVPLFAHLLMLIYTLTSSSWPQLVRSQLVYSTTCGFAEGNNSTWKLLKWCQLPSSYAKVTTLHKIVLT